MSRVEKQLGACRLITHHHRGSKDQVRDMKRHAIVRAAWDDEAGVWYVEESDIPGLATESETLDGLRQRIRDIIPDLLEDADDRPEAIELDIIAHAHERISTAA
jgi:predicted RNase H-like HicB family nuclease